MDFDPDQIGDDEDVWWTGVWGARDGLIFFVDCSKKMYDNNKVHDSMEIIEETMKNLIIKNEKNLVSFFSNF